MVSVLRFCNQQKKSHGIACSSFCFEEVLDKKPCFSFTESVPLQERVYIFQTHDVEVDGDEVIRRCVTNTSCTNWVLL